MEVEQRYVIKFVVQEGMKGVKIIGRLNKRYDQDALQQTQVYYCIKDVKSGRKDLSNISTPGRAQDEGLDDCIVRALKEDSHLSKRKIAEALTVSSATVRNHLTKSLGMKCYHKQ
jgi:predicted HTH transcriptional regulator